MVGLVREVDVLQVVGLEARFHLVREVEALQMVGLVLELAVALEAPQVVDLAPGSYQYKFIVDGQWRHDHTAPTAPLTPQSPPPCLHC